MEDDSRHGRPITAVTQKRTDAVREIVNAGPHISIDYLVYNLDIFHHRR
jgi:hypothetical protein